MKGRPGTTVRFLASSSKAEWSSYAKAACLAVLAVIGGIALLGFSGYLIARASQRPPILSLLVAIVLVRASGLARAFARYGERLLAHDAALRTLARLRAAFYARLIPLVPGATAGAVRSWGRGELLSRFVGDVESLQDAYVRGVAPVLTAVFGITAAAGALAALGGPLLALAIAAPLLLGTVLVPLSAALLAWRAGRSQAPRRAVLSSQLLDGLAGSAELALGGLVGWWRAGVERSERLLAKATAREGLASGAAELVAGLCTSGALIAVLYVAAAGLGQSRLVPALVVAAALVTLQSGEVFLQLAESGRRLAATKSAAGRIEEVLALAPTPAGEGSCALKGPPREVALEGVGFRYGPNQPLLLRDVTMKLTRGELVVVRGPSGAGKTTLSWLLVKLLEPVRGTIRLDSLPLASLAAEEVRRWITLVDQDPHLFNTSIANNLRIGAPQANDAALWKALARVGLARWVAAQPEGLNLVCGEAGNALSAGQRRRLAVCRALLGDSPFLVLDEPTAGLDPTNQNRVVEALRTEARWRGVLVISHRPLAAGRVGRTVWLEGGRVRPGDHPAAACV